MNAKNFATAAIVYAIICGIGSRIIVHQVDRATAQQCIEHAWPKNAHQIHMDWCADNGYKTN